MALSMDEERMLAEIERRLADDDPVLAARLTSFRLPRLALGPRSPRARLTASLLMLVVVAAISVFVYALMPFRAQNLGDTGVRGVPSTHPVVSTTAADTSKAAIRPAGARPRAAAVAAPGARRDRSSPSRTTAAYGK